MAPLPGLAPYFTIGGRLLDPSTGKPLTGTVTFTPTVVGLLVPNAPTPFTALPDATVAYLDADGDLAVGGVKGVQLVANNDPATNPTGNWNYKVSFEVRTPSGKPVKYPGYAIDAPSGVTADLTRVAQVNPGNGIPITVSPATTISIGSVETVGGDDDPLALNVAWFGAVPDNTTDAAPGINAAILAAHNAGGGDVVVPIGPYVVNSPIGFTDRYIENVRLIGAAPRGVRWRRGGGVYGGTDYGRAGSHLRATGNFPVLSGMWDSCEIKWLGLDGDGHGSPSVNAHFSKTIFERNELVRWSNAGMILNDGHLTDEIGFMNHIEKNNISDSGWEWGHGLILEYRFSDSWVEGNNIEAYGGADIVIRSGGPHRIIDNHCNGNRSPKHNVLIDGGVRNCLLRGNIFERAEEEAVKYIAPGWLTSPEETALLMNSNIFRDFGMSASKPAVGLYGTTGNPGFYALGASLVGNSFVSANSPTYVVEVNGFKDVSAVGNYWRNGHRNAEPVRATNCTGVEVGFNHGDNAVKTS